MITLDIIGDDALTSVLKKMISGILPHSNYEPKSFGTVIESINRYIKVDELEMEYYVLLASARKLVDITRTLNDSYPMLSRETLISIMENCIYSIVRKDGIGIKSFLEQNAYPSNLEVPEVFEEAVKLLFSRTLALYDEALAIESTADMALSYLPALEMSFLTNASEQAMRQQSRVLQKGVWDFKKREMMSGPLAWLDYVGSTALELQQRISIEEDSYVLDSVMKAEELIERLRANYTPMALYGIPPIDDLTPMLQHRYVILAGEENVGKTTIVMDWVSNLLIAKKKVCVFSGENDESKTFVQSVLPSYILKKYKQFITYQMVLDREQLSLDKQKIISMAIADITQSGLLRMINGMNYYTVYQTMKNVYDTDGFDAWIIDHSLALEGGGDFQTKLFHMSLDIKNFRKRYPVCVIVLSHNSGSARDALKSKKRQKQITSSPTKYSGFLSADADEVFVIYSEEQLSRKNLLGFIVYKRRGARKPLESHYLTMLFPYSSFKYEPEMQRDWGSTNLEEVLHGAGIDEEDEEDEEIVLEYDEDEIGDE